MYHPCNFHGLACVLAVALQSDEVDTRLDRPPRGKHKREAYLARQAYEYQRVKAGGQLSIRRFASHYVKKSYTAVNNWLDGKTHMRSDSEHILRALAPPDLSLTDRTVSDVEPLDPANGQSYDPPGSKTGGTVEDTHQARIVARWINRIDDDDVRDEALFAIKETMRRFLDVGAEKAGPPPRR